MLCVIASGTSWRAPLHIMRCLNRIEYFITAISILLYSFCRLWSETVNSDNTLLHLFVTYHYYRWRNNMYASLFLVPGSEVDLSLDNTLDFTFGSLVPGGSQPLCTRTWSVPVLVKESARFNNEWYLQRPMNSILKVMEPTQIPVETGVCLAQSPMPVSTYLFNKHWAIGSMGLQC